MKLPLGLLAALALAGFTGCASYPADRIGAHQAEFDSWPPDVQSKIRSGIVAAGFTPDQVLVALGEPNQKITASTPGGVTETWMYHRRAPRLSIGVGGGSSNGSTAVGGGISANGIKLGQDVGGRVVFVNGIVNEVEVMTR